MTQTPNTNNPSSENRAAQFFFLIVLVYFTHMHCVWSSKNPVAGVRAFRGDLFVGVRVALCGRAGMAQKLLWVGDGGSPPDGVVSTLRASCTASSRSSCTRLPWWTRACRLYPELHAAGTGGSAPRSGKSGDSASSTSRHARSPTPPSLPANICVALSSRGPLSQRRNLFLIWASLTLSSQSDNFESIDILGVLT